MFYLASKSWFSEMVFKALLVLAAAAVLSLLPPSGASAQPRDHGPGRGGDNRGGPPSYRGPAPRGGPVVVERLPRGHVTVRYKRNDYFYHHGHYFRRGGVGFFAIVPPIGLIVPFLPPGYTTVVVTGHPYYYYEGVYYRQAPTGFVVVSPPPNVVVPAPAPAPATTYGAISVTAAALNVRSGPGLNYPVMTVIQQGEIYPVQATAQGWLYIQLPDGRYGWVQQAYTAPAATVPSG